MRCAAATLLDAPAAGSAGRAPKAFATPGLLWSMNAKRVCRLWRIGTPMREFLSVFVPLFVAVDAIGSLPLLLGMLEHVEEARRRRVIVQSVLTAASVAAVFVIGGRHLLALLGVTPSDFMIAGGSLLFLLSLADLLSAGKPRRRIDLETVGAVPIGVPLITGPAVLTTVMLLVAQKGMLPTLAATLLNVLLAGAFFWFAVPVTRLLGGAGTKVLSKIASLVLASIGVMMVRQGVVELIVRLQGG